MAVVAALVVFATLAAIIAARARAAVPAVLFGVIAVVLFATTPLGSGIPEAVQVAATWIGDTAGQLFDAVDTS